MEFRHDPRKIKKCKKGYHLAYKIQEPISVTDFELLYTWVPVVYVAA